MLEKTTMNSEPTVFIVDNDEAVLDSLRMLMKSVGLRAECFRSAAEFLDAYDPERSGCLVLDVRMPGMSGIDLQGNLVAMHSMLPIIFITGHGDIEMAVHAMRAGAVDFVQKPFSDQVLLDRIQQTVAQDVSNRESLSKRDEVARRMERLTPREKEVMSMVVSGKANKVIAIDLGVSERTVEIHRARVMKKMEATSLPHLVRMVLEVEKRP
jgi:FixJ family two-component response regulator